MDITGEQCVRKALLVAREHKAIDPLILDVRRHCSFTDYFLVCSAASFQQQRAIADGIERCLKKLGVRHYGHREGGEQARWLLLDYDDFIVHVFMEEARGFYNLEQLWSRAPRLEEGSG